MAMFMDWVSKRVCQVFLKGLNKYLIEDINVEQLDLQLLSGIGQVKDLGLNTDYINDQIKSLPFVLESGSIDRILVKLPKQHIEVDGLHLKVAPRGWSEKVAEFKRAGNTGDRSEASSPEYAGVSDGLKLMFKIIRNLMFRIGVKLTGTVIELEDHATVSIRCLEYDYEDVNSATIVKLVKVVDATLDAGGNPVLGPHGVSASVRASFSCKDGGAQPKFSFHACVEPVVFRASFDLVEQLISVGRSYAAGGGNAGTDSIYHDASSFYDSRSGVLDNNKVDYPGKYIFPVIADWMRKPELSEPELEASVDEFFECMDALNQSVSSSGIWNWTRSTFGAASVSENLPIEDTQMQLAVVTRLKGVSGMLLYDSNGKEGLKLTLEEVVLNCQQFKKDISLEAQIRCIEISQLGPTSSQEPCYRRLSKTDLPRFSVGLNTSSGGVKILRVTPFMEQPAAKMVFRRLSSNNGYRTKVSISLQPLVSWIDASAVDKLLQRLSQLQNSLHGAESVDCSKSDFKLDISLPAMRTFLTNSQSSSECVLALDLGTISANFRAHGQQKKDGRSLVFTAADGILYTISSSASSQLVRISGKTVVDMKWTENAKTGPWVAKKIWDGVAAQRMSYESSEGSNSEFASATTLGLEFDASTFDLLKATSSLNIDVSVTRLLLDFSRTEHFEVLKLLSHPEAERKCNNTKVASTQQILFTFSVREVEVDMLPLKTYEQLQVQAAGLRIAFGAALGRDPSASYFQINHGDGALMKHKTELISFKASAIGRGDGGSRNALSTGTAGLTLTMVSRPGKEQLEEVIVAGCTKGMTILTEGGQFDWMTAVINFSDKCCEPFQKPRDEQVSEDKKRSHFFFNFQDAALRYEPVSTNAEAQNLSSVGCVLGVASLWISGGEPAEHNILSLRDVGLHIVDTRLRKSDCAPRRSLQDEGCVQVASSPVLGAKLKISGTQLPNWEIEFTDNQLNFDTCSDTFAAFGSLVSDLQQIFASDVQKSAEMQLRTMRGKSAAGSEIGDDGDIDGLFTGLVEDAFACPKVVESRAVHAASSSTSLETTVVLQTRTRTVNQIEQPDSPVFIEDYLLEHVSHVSLSSSQESEPAKQAVSDAEQRCALYSSLDFIDTHVPFDKGSSPKKGNSSYPPAVGKVGFAGWKVRWRLYGGSDWENQRSNTNFVQVLVQGMDFQYETFGPTGLYASSLIVKVRDVDVHYYSDDTWGRILKYYSKKSCPREYTSKAVEFHMDAVRPNPSTPLEEYRLTIGLLPLCLHLDQDHVDFFVAFFSSDKETDQTPSSVNEDTILPFFQVCEIRSTTVHINYTPQRLNCGALKAGNVFELLNLWSWKGVELELKEVHTSGVYGWDSLLGRLLDQWLDDISRHQIHQCLLGAAPIRPVYSVSSGAAQLFILPAEQYRKDRRFLRGMRKGAVAFFHSISLEALGLGANLAAGARQVLVHTEKALGGGSLPGEKKDQRRKSQPSGPREGLQQAYESIAQGLNRTAISLVSNPVKVYQRGGGAGVAVASAIKASPGAILAPASAAADAVHHALIGIRNGLDPERKRAHDEKHTGPVGDVKRWR